MNGLFSVFLFRCVLETIKSAFQLYIIFPINWELHRVLEILCVGWLLRNGKAKGGGGGQWCAKNVY